MTHDSRLFLGNARIMTLVSLVVVVFLVVLLMYDGDRATPGAEGETLLMYCAAGIIKPVQAAAREYEQAYGVRVQIEPGGSGKLLSQIRISQGRGHLYLAGDDWYIQKARRDGLVAESMPVAQIYPVIVVGKANPKRIAGVDDLLREDVKVALANPELASIGRTVQQLFERMNQWKPLMDRVHKGAGVSFTGTVNEVAQAVRIGAVDAGIVWDSLAGQFSLQTIEIDAFTDAKQTIAIGILEPNERPTASLQFARYLTASDRGLRHFQTHKFSPVSDADLWAEHPEVVLMAGAMLKPVIEQTIRQFENREGVTIKSVYNGCGILVAQMRSGHEPAAYIACDASFMVQVSGLFEPSTVLSRNEMVIVVPRGNPGNIEKLSDLARPGLNVGLAHPTHSALGALTDQLLKKLGLHERIYAAGNRIIHTDAGHMLINQIRTGSLDACVVYRSNLMSNRENIKHLELIPIDRPDALATQPYAIARGAGHKQLMKRFFEAVTASSSEQHFKSLGFQWAHGGGEP